MASIKSLITSAGLVAGIAGCLLPASPAKATPIGAPLIAGNTADIKWVASAGGGVTAGLGTSDVTLDGVTPTTLTLAVIQTVTGAVSLGGIFGALAWDQDLGNELNGPGTLVETTLGFFMPGTPGYNDPLIAPATRDSTGALSGYALGLDSINGGAGFMIAGPSGLTFTAFTVTFTVNPASIASDGNDIFWGAFGTGNAIGTDTGGTIYAAVNSPWAGASINVPEPGALPLIALATGALLLVGRIPRRR